MHVPQPPRYNFLTYLSGGVNNSEKIPYNLREKNEKNPKKSNKKSGRIQKKSPKDPKKKNQQSQKNLKKSQIIPQKELKIPNDPKFRSPFEGVIYPSIYRLIYHWKKAQ